jgi:hypothetical protein
MASIVNVRSASTQATPGIDRSSGIASGGTVALNPWIADPYSNPIVPPRSSRRFFAFSTALAILSPFPFSGSLNTTMYWPGIASGSPS